MSTPTDIVELIKKEGVQVVDFRFMDFPGLWQHFSVPAGTVDEDTFSEGLGFDGSSIRGWQKINESDMIVKPRAPTAFLDPFAEHKTIVLICDICDPITGEDYTRDPRHIARKSVTYMQSLGLGDTAFVGPEAGERACGAHGRLRPPNLPRYLSETRDDAAFSLERAARAV